MVVKDFFYFKNHCAAAIEIQPLLKFKNIFNSSWKCITIEITHVNGG